MTTVERAVEHAYATWHDELADCIKEAQRDGAIDKKQNPQALATTLLAFMRGQEALHKGGAKPAQLKAAGRRDDLADSHRLTSGIEATAPRVVVLDRMVQNYRKARRWHFSRARQR